MVTYYIVLQRPIAYYAKEKDKRLFEGLLRHSLKLRGTFINTEDAEKYHASKSTIIDKIAVSIQQQARFTQNQRDYFVVPVKPNAMVFIPGKNSVFVLAGITLVLEEIRFLNEYRQLFLSFSQRFKIFIELQTTYD